MQRHADLNVSLHYGAGLALSDHHIVRGIHLEINYATKMSQISPPSCTLDFKILIIISI